MAAAEALAEKDKQIQAAERERKSLQAALGDARETRERELAYLRQNVALPRFNVTVRGRSRSMECSADALSCADEMLRVFFQGSSIPGTAELEWSGRTLQKGHTFASYGISSGAVLNVTERKCRVA
jgi:hypothetical protein